MTIREWLSERVGISEVLEIVCLAENDEHLKQELYLLLFDTEDRVAYQAAWVLTHFTADGIRWLYDKQDALIDEVLVCHHPGKRRLILNLLYSQPFHHPIRVNFLDFCLDRMMSAEELPGVKTLCMKLAYELCREIPELLQELSLILDVMEPGLLPVSIRTVRKNIKKKMNAGKGLRHL